MHQGSKILRWLVSGILRTCPGFVLINIFKSYKSEVLSWIIGQLRRGLWIVFLMNSSNRMIRIQVITNASVRSSQCGSSSHWKTGKQKEGVVVTKQMKKATAQSQVEVANYRGKWRKQGVPTTLLRYVCPRSSWQGIFALPCLSRFVCYMVVCKRFAEAAVAVEMTKVQVVFQCTSYEQKHFCHFLQHLISKTFYIFLYPPSD